MSSPAMCCDKPFSSHCVSRYVCGLMADRRSSQWPVTVQSLSFLCFSLRFYNAGCVVLSPFADEALSRLQWRNSWRRSRRQRLLRMKNGRRKHESDDRLTTRSCAPPHSADPAAVSAADPHHSAVLQDA